MIAWVKMRFSSFTIVNICYTFYCLIINSNININGHGSYLKQKKMFNSECTKNDLKDYNP